jgi:hypothetical protein
MSEQEKTEKDAPWRETPLDHWSLDVDPYVMSGDQWVDNLRDPGAETEESLRLRDPRRIREMNLRGERFMHPVHDVTYRDGPLLG